MSIVLIYLILYFQRTKPLVALITESSVMFKLDDMDMFKCVHHDIICKHRLEVAKYTQNPLKSNTSNNYIIMCTKWTTKEQY